jgi:competence protein ComEA
VIAAALVVLAYRSEPDPGVALELRDPPSGIDQILVHVSGAVRAPGVVTVEPGERVVDAIERAGGAAPDADLDALNLSRRLVDEDRIVVPVFGAAARPLDVNSATAAELEALPGIGPAYASAIVDERDRAGPFSDTDELVSRGVLPERVYEGIRDLVAAPWQPRR